MKLITAHNVMVLHRMPQKNQGRSARLGQVEVALVVGHHHGHGGRASAHSERADGGVGDGRVVCRQTGGVGRADALPFDVCGVVTTALSIVIFSK